MTNNIILAVAVWLIKTPPARSSADSGGGWLARHESRPLRAVAGKHAPYVDLSPLDLTRRH